MQLTKTLYTIGIQCPLWLWTEVNEKETLPEVDEFSKKLIRSGYEVEELVAELFPNAEKQKEASINNLYVRADYYEEGTLIEIKSSTQAKDIYFHDLAFQKYVFEKSGIKITKCVLVYVNKEYIKKGEFDLKEFFTVQDVTQEVNQKLIDVSKNIELFEEIIKGEKPDSYCECSPDHYKKYDCPAHQIFKKQLPKENVFELSRGTPKALKLYKDGIVLIKDIPPEVKLTPKQSIQRDCAIQQKEYISKEHIKHFIESLEYPLYHFDFEAVQPTIPIFDGSRPLQQIPVQYSLHIEQENGELEHKEFLGNAVDDPREALLKQLIGDLGEKGSIIVYHQDYEKSRLKELAKDFPEFSEKIQNLIDRIVDLKTPFSSFYYYNPCQKGSASIKKVLPALTDLSYTGLKVGNGTEAINAYFSLIDNPDQPEIRTALLEYCKLDTFAMVEILRRLKEIVVK